MKKLLIVCLIMVSLAIVANSQSTRDKMVLSGIKDVNVVVRVDNDKLLNKYDIEFDVSKKLNKSNLKSDSNSSRDIFISIDTVKNEDGSYAYSIILYLDEDVILQRNNKAKFKATVLDIGGIYAAKSKTLSSDVRKKVLYIVDRLIERYDKANS